jgi:CDP-glucose 4,6-dehydratase
MGTAHVLEACRKTQSVRSVVVVTTDKVYANREWLWGYRETDGLGGHDPYSGSKVAVEHLVESYRKAFFETNDGILLATARAGNVIGGGDWSQDRLIPDCVRAIHAGKPLEVRFPDATRPWQHILECLNGYLLLGQKLLEGNRPFAEAWNFGPDAGENRAVSEILAKLKNHWPQLNWQTTQGSPLHEAKLLYLDNTKSKAKLGWSPVWTLDQCLRATADWYRHHQKTGQVDSRKQLTEFIESARLAGHDWTGG